MLQRALWTQSGCWVVRGRNVLGHAAVVVMDTKWLLGTADDSMVAIGCCVKWAGPAVFGSPFCSSGCPSIPILLHRGGSVLSSYPYWCTTQRARQQQGTASWRHAPITSRHSWSKRQATSGLHDCCTAGRRSTMTTRNALILSASSVSRRIRDSITSALQQSNPRVFDARPHTGPAQQLC